MLYKCDDVLKLTENQLKEINKCQFVDECSNIISASEIAEKVQIVSNEKQGRYSLAREKILCGEIVVSLNGTMVDKPLRWTVQLDEDVYIVGSGAVNHHCVEPNLVIDLEKMAFVARRDIDKGEELTINYLTFEKTMSEPFECFCCSIEEGCYSTISGFSHLDDKQKGELTTRLNILPYML